VDSGLLGIEGMKTILGEGGEEKRKKEKKKEGKTRIVLTNYICYK
jgi:hypothetical protein